MTSARMYSIFQMVGVRGLDDLISVSEGQCAGEDGKRGGKAWMGVSPCPSTGEGKRWPGGWTGRDEPASRSFHRALLMSRAWTTSTATVRASP